MVGPTSIAQVTNLKLEVFAEFGAALLCPLLLNLMLDLPRVKQVKLKEGNAEDFTELVLTVRVILACLLIP